MYLHKLCWFIASSLLSFTLFGQSQSVQGSILDQDHGTPLVGVSVLVAGSSQGTFSDESGAYNIQATQGDTLIFSYIGFITTRLVVKNESAIDVRLQSGLALKEVVVTALGLQREQKALGYAIQSLQSEDIDQVKSVNFLDNLGAKFAGVQINQGATGVGSSSRITIRGESSFTQNNPLFVVDGIPINNSTLFNATNEAASGFQEVDFGNGAMDINADDIASVSVLKGPGAAAIYGTRASNGVIVIETKDGSQSPGGLGVSFNVSSYVDEAFQLPVFQNKFGQGNNGEFRYVDGLGGGINDNITYSYGPQLDMGLLIPQYDSPVSLSNGQVVRGGDIAIHGGAEISPTPFVSRPNNLRDFYQTGSTNIQNLALNGAYERGSYRLSMSNLNSESIIPGVNYDRQNVQASLSFKPHERLSVRTKLHYIHAGSDNRPGSGYGSENINYALVAWLGRQTDLNPMRNYWQPGLENVQQFSYNYTFFDNPYFTLFENRNSFGRDRLIGSTSLQYDITQELSFMLRAGMDYSSELRQFRRAFSSNRFRKGAYAEQDLSYREINTDFLLRYEKQWGDFSLDASIGGNRMDQRAESQQIQTLSLAQPGIFNFSNAATPLESFVDQGRKRINSTYGLLKLGFRQTLFLDITGRNDWSTALANIDGADNTSFFYPSASASLILSKFMALPKAISFWKIRASWAEVGNDTAPYQTSNVFLSQTPFAGQPTFSHQNFIANQNLVPERTRALEFGTDLRFWDDRLQLDLTYYESETDNQILSLPIGQSTGYTQQIVNGGAVSSQGVELAVSAWPVYQSRFKWKTQLNFSRNVSTVKSLPDDVDQITLAYNRVYDNVNQTVWFIVSEGSRIGDIWGTGYLRNEAGEFVINQDGRFIVDNSLKKLGNYNPDFLLGWRNELTLNRLKIGFTFDWRQGGEIVSRTQSLAGVAGQLIETGNRPSEGIIAQGVVNIGSAENPSYAPNTTPISAEAYYRQFYDRNHEENNVLDASFLKLREFYFRYQFDDLKGFQWAKGLALSLIGRNLFAISAIKHFDPEQLAVQGTQFVGGVEDMSYATTRSWGVSLSLDF